MIRAAKVKELSTSSDLKIIENEIKSAAKRGFEKVTIWHIPNEKIRKHLYSLGYSIDMRDDKVIISW